jgi:hypothetical protein
MNEIVVIGTVPPCPRCSLLGMLVAEKVRRMGIEAEIRHLSYTDEESVKFAKSIGLEPGTAKDVAKRINEEIDKEKLAELLKGNGGDEVNSEENDTEERNSAGDDSQEICICNAFSSCNWSYELDEFLRPYENRAKEAGILMTPVLIINGELKHSGSVPDIEKINEWMDELS